MYRTTTRFLKKIEKVFLVLEYSALFVMEMKYTIGVLAEFLVKRIITSEKSFLFYQHYQIITKSLEHKKRSALSRVLNGSLKSEFHIIWKNSC